MTETIRLGNVGKLWMLVPRTWDSSGMANVEVTGFSPTPDDVFDEAQGNRLAFWNVNYRSTAEYSIAFRIDLAPIKYQIDPGNLGAYDTSSPEYQLYTKATATIQSAHAEIVSLANQIAGSETNPYYQARAIHAWVVENVRGWSQGGEPPGRDALTVLRARSAGCDGFSALFIALLRARGIPARFVAGIHTGYRGYFTTTDDWRQMGFHAWTEFHLPGYGWIQSDASAGARNFAEIDEPRIVLMRGEDVELGHAYPLVTLPVFNMPQVDAFVNSGYPPTNTVGEGMTLIVQRLH